MFIALEGIDGSGKTTVTSQLSQSLLVLDKTCCTNSQPTSWFKRMPLNLPALSNLEIIALFSADRGFDQELLAMQIDQYDFVIRDRYSFSTYAYNCTNESEIAVYEGLNRSFIKPDLTVFIDTPIPICLDRIKQRNSPSDLDYFERKSLSEVRDRYLRKLSLLNWSQSFVVNGNQPTQFIVSDILRKLGFTDRTMQVFSPKQ